MYQIKIAQVWWRTLDIEEEELTEGPLNPYKLYDLDFCFEVSFSISTDY